MDKEIASVKDQSWLDESAYRGILNEVKDWPDWKQQAFDDLVRSPGDKRAVVA